MSSDAVGHRRLRSPIPTGSTLRSAHSTRHLYRLRRSCPKGSGRRLWLPRDPGHRGGADQWGALIVSGGWTAYVARTTTRNATVLNQATLDAARENRLWDKRAEDYAKAMRVFKLVIDLIGQLLAENAPKDLANRPRPREVAPDWPDIEIRLLTFGSESVIAAMQDASEAFWVFDETYQEWLELAQREQAESESEPAEGYAPEKWDEEVRPTAFEARDEVDGLLNEIRDDLNNRPSAVQPHVQRRSRRTRRTARGSEAARQRPAEPG